MGFSFQFNEKPKIWKENQKYSLKFWSHLGVSLTGFLNISQTSLFFLNFP